MIVKKNSFPALLLMAALAVGGIAHAQIADPPVPIDASAVRKIASDVAAAVEQNYVFPDRAFEMAKLIRGKLEAGSYAAIGTSQDLRQQLEADLRSVNGDKHLAVFFNAVPNPIPSSTEETTEQERRFNSYANNGFVKAERLEGNVGYIDIRGFSKPEFLKDATAAAFGFVGDTAALIIDMRQNGGGWPAGVAWITSYLFTDRVHLNDLQHREGNRIEEFWTTADAPGRKYADRPVYVLTSKNTFSAGEEFTYNLQALKRAVVVGEATGGGAHPVKPFQLNDHFQVWIPFARSVNPVTKQNWEGRGVAPDVNVAAEKALDTAYLAALKAARAKEKNALIAADQDRAIATVLSSEAALDRQSQRTAADIQRSAR
ncbi:S41 family peptidase [Variovorax sp. H27-G14]|uniref:S41 family peptidase n=1 Tax=Variovorax sp. H27-G14 TaxID=3111914 RepID=UPI0038FC1F3C